MNNDVSECNFAQGDFSYLNLNVSRHKSLRTVKLVSVVMNCTYQHWYSKMLVFIVVSSLKPN